MHMSECKIINTALFYILIRNRVVFTSSVLSDKLAMKYSYINKLILRKPHPHQKPVRDIAVLKTAAPYTVALIPAFKHLRRTTEYRDISTPALLPVWGRQRIWVMISRSYIYIRPGYSCKRLLNLLYNRSLNLLAVK